MAAPTKAAAGSCSACPCTYDVFLSFRGKDTRKTFTGHLYTALKQAGFHTFRDDDEIERGEKIDAELRKAIEDSRISIIVFSKDYASSTWCLDELVMIMKRRRVGQTVLPIFYDVAPSQLRERTGSFASAFSKHKRQLRKEIDRVNAWKTALKEVADLGGLVLNNRHESLFIQDIVREIQKKLNPRKLDVTPHLVGINSILKRVNSWLEDENHEAAIATIYGIGGVGKTTIAKVVYNENSDRFESSSFIANVRDSLKEPSGLVRMQNQLLSDLLKGKVHEVYNKDDGIVKINNAMCCKKVLIVFDDIDESRQLDAFIGRRKQLVPGSKIIVTTRHERLLRPYEISVKFQVEELSYDESLQLFSWHAFGKNHPIDGYKQGSTEASRLCGGLPLALEVLGSSLSGNCADVWKDALRKLKGIPDRTVQRVLRISYDSLDDHDQNLFLHICCFFVGMDKNYVAEILNGCGFYAMVGIQNLVDRCLVSIDEASNVKMHQLLMETGREIVRQESPADPGKRSRLWNRSDACNVLQDKTGTEHIKGLVLDPHKLRKLSCSGNTTEVSYYTEQHFEDDYLRQQPMDTASALSFQMSEQIDCETTSFVKMHKLQLLQLDNVNMKGDYENLPKNLALLSWHDFPLKSMPTNFCLKKLVSLDLSYSALKTLWDRTLVLPKLKFLNLTYCRELIRTPDFSGLPRLERLILRGCMKIFEVDESINGLKSLMILNLGDCTNLRRLPKHFGMLKSLEQLHLSGCSNLEELPEDLWKLKSLKILLVEGNTASQLLSTTIETRILSLLSSRIRHPVFQSWLRQRKDSRLPGFSLPLLPCSLISLSLESCNLSNDNIPRELGSLESLTTLNLSGNPFQNLPQCINNLTKLKRLLIRDCTRVQSLPKLPLSLKFLEASNCSSLERIATPQDLSKLFSLYVDNCDRLVEIQDLFKIEPANNIDQTIIESLGLSDLEYLANTEVHMFNGITFTERTTPIQLLRELGILSIFIPGNDAPNCYTLQRKGPFISFTVVPLGGHELCGLNLCISYALHYDQQYMVVNPLFVKITNVTKQRRWSYNPACYAIPEEGRDMIWLSHWKFEDQLDVGDEVHVTVITPKNFHVKVCGVSFIYRAQLKQTQSAEATVTMAPNPHGLWMGKRCIYHFT